MTVSVQVSEVIDRPVTDVFHFHAEEHVLNHPRWDQYMQLEQVSDGPIGVGTIINRVNSRSGRPVEGTMEIVEFIPNQVIGMVIHDGPVEIIGRATYEVESDDRTTLKLDLEFPGMDENLDTSSITSQIQQSLQNIKHLIESEV
jgi:uncharacterized membrane protein